MTSITKTFSAVGVTQEMLIKKGEILLFRFDALASWDGTVILRKTVNQQTFDVLETFTATDDNGATLVADEDANYSFQCTVFTAGTAAVTLSNLSTNSVADEGVGTPSIPTCTVEEIGDGVLKRTILRLASVPVSVVSVTTGAGVGGTELYGFPLGHLNILGCIADLSCVIAAGEQADFTDATPAGDIGIGTLAPANADALGTDATDDDFATAVALTMAAYSSNSQLVSEPALLMDGTSTAKNLFVNLLIDAADIDDDTTSIVYVSGVIVLTWLNLGDV
ncbi:MAG: hypothetical protein KAR06_06970 [Deltaproteobacteria bacterium]|nr:hypothetical protein [Deltaproteobacteria bacterium]